jgi:hypothetical protein
MLDFNNSLKLKSIGFPQPTPALGQRWYSSNGQLSVIGLLAALGELKAISIQDTSWEHTYDMNGFVYCPTSEDLLAELQKGCRNGFWWNLTPPMRAESHWSCNCIEAGDGKVLEFRDAISVVACFEAYLSVKRSELRGGAYSIEEVVRTTSMGLTLQQKADQRRHDKSVEALISAKLKGSTYDDRLAEVMNILDQVDEKIDGE